MKEWFIQGFNWVKAHPMRIFIVFVLVGMLVTCVSTRVKADIHAFEYDALLAAAWEVSINDGSKMICWIRTMDVETPPSNLGVGLECVPKNLITGKVKCNGYSDQTIRCESDMTSNWIKREE